MAPTLQHRPKHVTTSYNTLKIDSLKFVGFRPHGKGGSGCSIRELETPQELKDRRKAQIVPLENVRRRSVQWAS